MGLEKSRPFAYTARMTIKTILEEIIGLSCWRPWRGAGYAIYLELGDKLPNNPGESELRKGSYSIGLVSCPWFVYRDNQLLFGTNSSLSEIDQKIPILSNQKLVDIKENNEKHETSLFFANNLSIVISYTNPKDEWVVLTPKEEVTFNTTGASISSKE